MNNLVNVDLSLMFVTDHQIEDDGQFFFILSEALAGGATIIQLREKHLAGAALYQRALKAKALCDAAKVPLIINDNVDIALAVDCAGVHLGQRDLPIEVARSVLGRNKIIGLSVSNLAETLDEKVQFADYLGVSPLFATATKSEHLAKPLGLAGLAEIAKHTQLPLVSIGGIDETNTASAFEFGSAGVAVVSAISRADSPKTATQRLKQQCLTGTTT